MENTIPSRLHQTATGPLTENSKFVALAGWIIHDSRAASYEVWSGPQGVRNFLSVRYGQVFSSGLSASCERSEKTKYSYLHFAPQEEFFAIHPVQRSPSVDATSWNLSGLRDPVSDGRSSRQTGSHKSGSWSWNTHRIARNVPAACCQSSETKRTDKSCHHASSGVPDYSPDWRIG